MPKGPDPRANPAPLTELPRLLREGAAHFNARAFWHAHESWEEAWHSLRGAGREDEAQYLKGMILVAAALENATRGKEDGFKRQCAEGLFLIRTHAHAGERLGVARIAALLDALTHLYVDACRRVDWAAWNASGWQAPALELA